MKKIIILFILILSLTGCKDYVEINENAVNVRLKSNINLLDFVWYLVLFIEVVTLWIFVETRFNWEWFYV